MRQLRSAGCASISRDAHDRFAVILLAKEVVRRRIATCAQVIRRVIPASTSNSAALRDRD